MPLQLQKYQGCHCRQETGLLNKRIQHCWSQLGQLRSVSYGFVCILYSSRLIRLYSDHLKGQTDFTQVLVCIDICNNDIISFHLVHFPRKQACPRKVAPSKNFPLYSRFVSLVPLSSLCHSRDRCSQTFPFFHRFSASVYYTEPKLKNKKKTEEAWEHSYNFIAVQTQSHQPCD